MKLDQIAYYIHNERQAAAVAAYHGLNLSDFSVEDRVVGKVACGRKFDPNDTSTYTMSKAHLRFNYSLGIELELLTYEEGFHWHMGSTPFERGSAFLSHHGFHMEPGESIPAMMNHCPVAQHMITESHTNPYLIENGRRYEYLIVDTLAMLGNYSKFIWRIEG